MAVEPVLSGLTMMKLGSPPLVPGSRAGLRGLAEQEERGGRPAFTQRERFACVAPKPSIEWIGVRTVSGKSAVGAYLGTNGARKFGARRPFSFFGGGEASG